MNRLTLIKIHLYFSGIALVFIFLMSLSGSLHLFLGDEAKESFNIKSINTEMINDKDSLENVFKEQLAKIDPDYNYSYIKGSASSLMTRPTTRDYYTIKLIDDSVSIQKHSPSLRMKVMELHKGHGVRFTRTILGIFGLFLIGAVLSGLYLGLSSKPFRKITILASLSGTVIYICLLVI